MWVRCWWQWFWNWIQSWFPKEAVKEEKEVKEEKVVKKEVFEERYLSKVMAKKAITGPIELSADRVLALETELLQQQIANKMKGLHRSVRTGGAEATAAQKKKAHEDALEQCIVEYWTARQVQNVSVIEYTPAGNVYLRFNVRDLVFEYYSDLSVPMRFLVVVIRKWVLAANAVELYQVDVSKHRCKRLGNYRDLKLLPEDLVMKKKTEDVRKHFNLSYEAYKQAYYEQNVDIKRDWRWASELDVFREEEQSEQQQQHIDEIPRILGT